jgi:DNA-binding response OmpR family regulator
LVEDNPADVHLVEEALKEHSVNCQLITLNDGEKACRLIDEIDNNAASCPGLFILDLSLPKRSGREVLTRIKQSEVCSGVPVVILSSSSSPKDRADTSALGADLYIRKPSDLTGFMEIGLTLKAMLERSN